MTPISILYVHSSAQLYGSDRALLNLISYLDRERFTPLVVVPEEGPLIDALQVAGAEVYIQPLCTLHRTLNPIYWARRLLQLPKTVLTLQKLIRDRKVRLVHSNTSHVLDGAFAAKAAGVAHIWHVREIHTGLSRVGRVLARWIDVSSARVFTVSQASREAFFPGRAHDPKFCVIYDGVDMLQFHPQRCGEAVRVEFGVPTQAPVCGVVGRIAHWKGLRTFLEAAALVHRCRPDARFLVVGDAVTLGDAALKQTLLVQVRESDLADAVIFTGVRQDVPDVVAALNVHVLPSEMPEPWGLVVLEAMASGRPVVATRQGGPLEMVVDGETGYLIPPADADALAQALLALFENPELAETMGRAGRTRCESMFALDRAPRDMMAQYELLL